MALGISIIYWGLAGLYAHSGSPLPPVRIFTSSLNFTIGLLIIFRKPAYGGSPAMTIVKCLPSLIFGGLLFKLSMEKNAWPLYAEIMFGIGTVIALFAFAFLGRNFSVLPATRTLVTTGAYKLVRHPGYLGETIMVLACFLSGITVLTAALFAGFLISLLIRIHEEEKILSASLEYKSYKTKVPWRLLPYIW